MIDASLGASRLEDEPARGLDPAPAHVAVVDGLRGAAALLVLLYHCWVFTDPPLDGGPLRALAACGALGVDFFFVISGFVLFLPVARRGGAFGSVRGYLLRRVARIVPAYYASLLLQALAVPLLTPFATPFASAGGWLVLAAHLLFVQHELPASLAHAAGFRGDVLGFGVNGVLWSLSIEALFYVTLPLVAGAFFRRPLSGLLGALLATLCWRAAVPALGPGASAALIDQYPAFLLHFAFGMCGALLYVRLWPERRSRAATLVVVQLASLVALLLAMTSYGRVVAATPPGPGAAVELLPGLVPALAFAAFLVSSALAPPRMRTLLATPGARWLGDVSYGVFLWHVPLVLAVLGTRLVRPRTDVGFVVLCGLVVPASLLLGWLSRRLVEEPAIRWARGRSRGKPQAARR